MESNLQNPQEQPQPGPSGSDPQAAAGDQPAVAGAAVTPAAEALSDESAPQRGPDEMVLGTELAEEAATSSAEAADSEFPAYVPVRALSTVRFRDFRLPESLLRFR